MVILKMVFLFTIPLPELYPVSVLQNFTSALLTGCVTAILQIVGFGGQTLTAPIRLVPDLVQTTPHGEYRLLQEGDDWVLQFNHHQHWQPMYRFDLCEQQQSDYVMGNFWSAHWPQSHFRHHLLMCRHLPDGGKLTLTNFHFTHYENGHAVEQRNLPDVASLYAVMQEQFGLGVDDAKHGFTVDELALVMAAFDTHPEAGK